MILRYSILIVALLQGFHLAAQETLTMEEAIAIAVENNHDLRIAKNNTELAKIEASGLNQGYLPSLNAGGGITYANENQNVVQNLGDTTNSESFKGAVTETYNASVTAEYLIFDGLVRKFTNDKNAGAFSLAQLQERQQVENTVISIYENFFNVAFQQQLSKNLKINIENSNDRLLRAQKKLKYGQGTTLDELNAKVDLNTDSIAYIESVRDLKNLKRNLNLALGRDISTAFIPDTTVSFLPNIREAEILDAAKENNISTVLAKQNVLLSELDIKINRAQFLPKINGSGSYNWIDSQYPPSGFLLSNETYGINLGLNLTWNLFNGSSATRIKTSKITKQNREIELQKVQDQLLTDVLNAYENYTIAQYTLRAEEDNLNTNRLNFSRTQRQYGLGQITAVEYRQAQINLLNASNNYARAKYDLKITEVTLLQIGGMLVD